MRMLTAGLLLFACASSWAAEAPPDYRAEFNAGVAASKSGDFSGYLQHMEKAVELNEKPVNRPFLMYHVARALILNGRQDQAITMLGRIFDDRIESLIISYADVDPAFALARARSAYAALHSRMQKVEINAKPLSPALRLLEGAGCNLLASIGPDGVLLVDSGYAPAASSIRAALTRQRGGPIRWIINTHEHEDHVGGNAQLGKGATIVGDAAIRAVLSKEQPFIDGVAMPPKPEAALPTVMPDDRLLLRFNGEDVVIVRLPAHSSSDVAVWFRGSKVLHMGDDFFPGTSPRISPGEAPGRFLAALGALLAEVPDDAKVVSGHSPVVPAAELKKAFGETKRIYEWVRAGVDAGKSLAKLQEERGDIPADWVEFLYSRVGKDNG